MNEGDEKGGVNLRLEAWKQTIAVQQHFNDIELRIRNYAITLLGALFGVAAYAFKEHAPWVIVEGLLGASLILCYAFYFMDRHWYHRLLRGAVLHGQSIERQGPPEMKLTIAIGEASPRKVWWWKKELHSDAKIMAFYIFIAAAILFMGVLVFLFAPATENQAKERSASTTQRTLTRTEEPRLSVERNVSSTRSAWPTKLAATPKASKVQDTASPTPKAAR